MEKSMKKILFAFGLILSFQSFAQSGSHWKLLYVWDGASAVSISAKNSDMLLSIAEKTLSGKIGCNTYHGKLEYLKGNNIKPIKVVNTKENCPTKPDRLDNAVILALNVSNKLVIDKDRAKFYQGDKLVLEMKR